MMMTMRSRLILFVFIIILIISSITLDTIINTKVITISILSYKKTTERLVPSNNKIDIYLLDCYNVNSKSILTLKCSESLFNKLDTNTEIKVEVFNNRIIKLK